MKDRFSEQSDLYKQFRPSYPESLIDEILDRCSHKRLVWDGGTGNGQLAVQLAKHFEQVIASDISAKQIEEASRLSNIDYRVESAEKSSLQDQSVDLIAVEQAAHWFNFDAFYKEVRRVAAPHSCIAILGYGPIAVPNEIKEVYQRFYKETVGPYWDTERRYIDDLYQTIPFPFEEIKLKERSMNYAWTVSHLLSYTETWSAVKNYQKAKGHNPVHLLKKDILKYFSLDSQIKVSFPLLVRMGIYREV